MNVKNISQIDLNLLLIFDVVCTEKNTVRAAEKLGLSQPAVSHALTRLRDLFKDRLFVRASRGLIPTPRALELQGQIRGILQGAESLFFKVKAFDPMTAKKTFRIATTDYFEQLVLPHLLRTLSEKAPLVTVISRPTLGHLPQAQLESAEFDFAIAGFYGEIPERFFQQKLYEDDFVAVARKGLISDKTNLTIEQYASFKHLIVSPQGDLQSKAKEILKKKGFDIHYAAGVTSFLSPARILLSADLILTCPRKLALSFSENFPFKVYELPFKISPISVVQVWHEQNKDEPSHQWFRQVLRQVCSEL